MDVIQEEKQLKEKVRLRKLYLKNKDVYDKRNKEWRENNPEKFKITQRKASRKYYEKNKEMMLEKNKIWCENNPEKLKGLKKKANAKWYRSPGVKGKLAEYQRKRNKFLRKYFPESIKKSVYDPDYYQRNKEKFIENHKEWIKKNPEKHREYRNNWSRNATKKLSDTYLRTLFIHRYGRESLLYFNEVKDVLKQEVIINRLTKSQQ